MAVPSTPRPPILAAPQPKGRPGLALLGSLLIMGSLALAIFAVHGAPTSGATTVAGQPGATATAASGLRPNGVAPPNFVIAQDPGHQFALFVSTTWRAGQASVTIGGAAVAATTFAPASAALPDFAVALPPQPILAQQELATANDLITARGGANFTPTNGPTPVTIATVSWSRLDGTYQFNGQTVNISVFTRPLGTGSALVFYESLPLMFSQTEQENFQPMIQSLAFARG